MTCTYITAFISEGDRICKIRTSSKYDGFKTCFLYYGLDEFTARLCVCSENGVLGVLGVLGVPNGCIFNGAGGPGITCSAPHHLP